MTGHLSNVRSPARQVSLVHISLTNFPFSFHWSEISTWFWPEEGLLFILKGREWLVSCLPCATHCPGMFCEESFSKWIHFTSSPLPPQSFILALWDQEHQNHLKAEQKNVFRNFKRKTSLFQVRSSATTIRSISEQLQTSIGITVVINV